MMSSSATNNATGSGEVPINPVECFHLARAVGFEINARKKSDGSATFTKGIIFAVNLLLKHRHEDITSRPQSTEELKAWTLLHRQRVSEDLFFNPLEVQSISTFVFNMATFWFTEEPLALSRNVVRIFKHQSNAISDQAVKIRKLTEGLTNLATRLDKTKKELSESEKELEWWKTKCSQEISDTSKTDLKALVAQLRSDLASSVAKIAVLQVDKAQLTNDLNMNKTRVLDLERQQRIFERAIAGHTQETLDMATNYSRLEEKRKSEGEKKNREYEALEAKFKALQNEFVVFRTITTNDRNETQAKLDKNAKSDDENRAEISTLSLQLETLELEASELRVWKNSHVEPLENVQAERITKLEQEIRTKDKENKEMKALLEAKRREARTNQQLEKDVMDNAVRAALTVKQVEVDRLRGELSKVTDSFQHAEFKLTTANNQLDTASQERKSLQEVINILQKEKSQSRGEDVREGKKMMADMLQGVVNSAVQQDLATEKTR